MAGLRTVVIGWAIVTCLVSAGCATEDPSVEPTDTSPATSPGVGETGSPSPGSDPLLLGEGRTGNGIPWRFVVQPGEPACAQLRRTDEAGDFLICDEDSEQDFNGNERLRYAFGGLNDEQVPKFVIGITAPDVAKVVVNVPSGPSPEAGTVASPEVPGRRFFVVALEVEPAQEVLAVRGVDEQGRTVAGFRLGPPDERPSPLPTG